MFVERHTMRVGGQRELPFKPRPLPVLYRGVPKPLPSLELWRTLPSQPCSFPNIGQVMPQPYVARFFKILDRLKPGQDFSLVYKAFNLAWEAHAGVLRKDGKTPYFEHVLSVAELVAGWNGDADAIAAALCHDVLEDTSIPKNHLVRVLSFNVAENIDAVSKLEKQAGLSEERAKVETVKKLVRFSSGGDITPIIIKLADRLHNMRTLADLSKVSVKSAAAMARETLNVYAKIAKALGMWEVSRELEDLAFSYLEPETYQAIARKRDELLTASLAEMNKIIACVEAFFAGEPVLVNYEIRHIYELFQRMERWDINIEQLTAFDIYRLNLITQNQDQCYLYLGRLHQKFLPVQDSEEPLFAYRDYIAQPHPNGHKLLHCYVQNVPVLGWLLIQVRDETMWRQYRLGIFADVSDEAAAREKQSASFLLALWEQLDEDVKANRDLYQAFESSSSRIKVFTPKGDAIILPFKATVIDFARAVHEDVLLTLVGARLNGKSVEVTARLKYGDQVQVFTDENAKPKIEWLAYAASALAKKSLRQFFNANDPNLFVDNGRRLMAEACERYYITLANLVGSQLFAAYLRSIAIAGKGVPRNTRAVLAAIGSGKWNVDSVMEDIRKIFITELYRARENEEKQVPFFVALKVKDRAGLLHDLTNTLKDLGYNIKNLIILHEDDKIIIIFGVNIYGDVDENGVVTGRGVVGTFQANQVKTVAHAFAREDGVYFMVSLAELITYTQALTAELTKLI